MRPAETRYPVDRYLVESSKKIDMVNIIDDDIWDTEPALRPEDEIILRKLHDMLQSTADDLKLLSGELTRYHVTDVQRKTLPTPLDEEFNEKVHIEEVVNAKFHGRSIIETAPPPNRINKNVVNEIIQSVASKSNTKQLVNHGVQVSRVPSQKKTSKPRNLGISRTNIIQIAKPNESKTVVNNNEQIKKKNMKTVTYNEISHKYAEPKPILVKKPLQIQEMPSINIRSELKEQKVVQLNINPVNEEVFEDETTKSNALVIEMKHEDVPKPVIKKPITFDHIQYSPLVTNDKPIRKISKMSAYESESTNNASSESQDNLRRKLKSTISLRASKNSNRTGALKAKKDIVNNKDVKRDGKRNIDEWKKKLNAVYGGPSKLKSTGSKGYKATLNKSDKQKATSHKNITTKNLNNTEYIPYSKLTIGGVNVSDIEREISDIPNRGEIVLSPILDKILSSRENSFHKDSPRKNNKNKSPRILTTSDENLLQEVVDIEREISRSTSTKNGNNNNNMYETHDNKDGDSYDDDFEDDNTKNSEQAQSEASQSESLHSTPINNSKEDDNLDNPLKHEIKQQDKVNIHNKTYTKISNLSFKNTVDIFEFVHSVDTQDSATQINASNNTIRPEHQTSSSEEKSNVQPIHNDLWPSIDPRGEVEKMFKLEKEFIKKLILDEYGDLLEKQLNKPSTSKNVDSNNFERNVIASQKNTQTSPAHVRSVMTSPTRTKTRTTSPFTMALTVNKQTSPMVVVSNQEHINVEVENDEDLGISVNLSSPRFSLRLPHTSREIISNIQSENSNRDISKTKLLRRNVPTSSSSDENYSSSDISSLGQIHKMYKRRLRKSRIPSISEISSSSSSLSRYKYSTDRSGAVVPLRSEGEASIGRINIRRSNKHSKSEGEVSLGQLN